MVAVCQCVISQTSPTGKPAVVKEESGHSLIDLAAAAAEVEREKERETEVQEVEKGKQEETEQVDRANDGHTVELTQQEEGDGEPDGHEPIQEVVYCVQLLKFVSFGIHFKL